MFSGVSYVAVKVTIVNEENSQPIFEKRDTVNLGEHCAGVRAIWLDNLSVLQKMKDNHSHYKLTIDQSDQQENILTTYLSLNYQGEELLQYVSDRLQHYQNDYPEKFKNLTT